MLLIYKLNQRFRFYANGFGVAPLRFTSIEDERFHYTNNPNVVIVEYKLHGNTLPDGKHFSFELYVNVIEINNGEIIELIDYEDVEQRIYLSGLAGQFLCC